MVGEGRGTAPPTGDCIYTAERGGGRGRGTLGEGRGVAPTQPPSEGRGLLHLGDHREGGGRERGGGGQEAQASPRASASPPSPAWASHSPSPRPTPAGPRARGEREADPHSLQPPHTHSRGRRATSQRTATSARSLKLRTPPGPSSRPRDPSPLFYWPSGGWGRPDWRLLRANEKPPSLSQEGEGRTPPSRWGCSSLPPAPLRSAPPPLASSPNRPMRWLRGWGEGVEKRAKRLP